MKKILIVVSAALAIASFTGCKKKTDGSGAAVAKMTEFKDKMCKCAEGDIECAKKVSDEMMKWGESQPKQKEGAVAKADPKAEEVTKQMSDCMTKAMTPKMGGTDPAMGGSAADPAAGSAADPAAGSAADPAAAGSGAADPGSAVAPAGSAEEKK